MTLTEFILQHENDDTSALLLARHRFPDIDIDLAVTTIECRRRLRRKVPSWYAEPALLYPSRLAAEQCSSEETALLKARVALSVAAEGRRIADLTGGMGVDSWAFSRVFGEVLYNEMQPALAEATKENFALLGVTNVQFRCRQLVAGDSTDGRASLPANAGNLLDLLDGFRPDMIYMDPARRAEDGRKVFRLADCRPDVPALLPELFAACPKILLKLSPMADITQLSRELPGLRAVTVVGADGECKELLLALERGYAGPYTLTVCEKGAVLAFEADDRCPIRSSMTKHNAGTTTETSWPAVSGHLLFEPGKALAKAGVFRQIGARFGLSPIGASTHLYTAESIPEELQPFGKVFEIEEVLPLNNETFRSLRRRIPSAEITARNLPLTSDALRKKLGIVSGGTQHLFGVRSDASGNLLLVTTPVFCK